MTIKPYIYVQNWWKQWPWKLPTLVALVLIIVLLVSVSLSKRGSEEGVKEKENQAGKTVTVQSFSELSQQSTIDQPAIIKAASSAPLIARTGGRVTAVSANLGDKVSAGATIASIDGGIEANPTRTQVAGLSRSLVVFNDIEKAAIQAADTAIQIAEINRQATDKSKPLNTEAANVARRIADNSFRQAELTRNDAKETGNDTLIRSAEIAYNAASFAQDQATVSRQLVTQQGASSLKLAEQSEVNARQAKERVIAEMSSQRSQLTTQLGVAREQVRMQQVTAPLSGTIVRLSVKPGDYVTPGQQVGEVNALAGAKITLDVSEGVRNALEVGRVIDIVADKQTFTGEVTNLATAPNSATSLWQVEVYVASTPLVVHPNQTVVVKLPIGLSSSDTHFVPLDAVTVRQNGIVMFTVNADNTVQENVLEVVGYDSNYVEARVAIPSDARVVVKGNRDLRQGDAVTIKTL